MVGGNWQVEITEQVKTIKKNLKILSKLEKEFSVKPNNDNDDPLFYCGVAKSNIINELTPLVEEYFGKAYKPAGETAILKNFFDPFIKAIGGIHKNQTLFKKDIDKDVILYCAFWPWGSDPVRTSIRVGLICLSDDLKEAYTSQLKGYF